MIAKKNASISLQAERQMHVQNGFLVVSALVCAAFAWRSPLIQEAVIEPTYAMHKDPIMDPQQKVKEKPKPEPIKVVEIKMSAPVLQVTAKVTDLTTLLASTDKKVDGLTVAVNTNVQTTMGETSTIGKDEFVTIQPEIVEIPDIEAVPVIGMYGLKKYVMETVVYPEVSIEAGDEGKVHVQFVVEKDGSMTNIKIARGVTDELDKEALRVVRSFGEWIPGENNGVKVRTKFRYVVDFKLKK